MNAIPDSVERSLQALADAGEAAALKRLRRQRELELALTDAIRHAEALWRLEVALRSLAA
jgi:hypothetical protein